MLKNEQMINCKVEVDFCVFCTGNEW